MAIRQKAAASKTTTAETKGKARGFLNLTYPSRAGENLRVHSIPLNDATPVLKQIADYIEGAATPEEQAERIAAVVKRMVGQFNKVRTEEEQELDFDFS